MKVREKRLKSPAIVATRIPARIALAVTEWTRRATLAVIFCGPADAATMAFVEEGWPAVRHLMADHPGGSPGLLAAGLGHRCRQLIPRKFSAECTAGRLLRRYRSLA